MKNYTIRYTTEAPGSTDDEPRCGEGRSVVSHPVDTLRDVASVVLASCPAGWHVHSGVVRYLGYERDDEQYSLTVFGTRDTAGAPVVVFDYTSTSAGDVAFAACQWIEMVDSLSLVGAARTERAA